ncbi:YrhB family protein [Chitinophaga nivalis]|uniref:YrhB family protein n=1 Tax=Chitinophaga nivalis TaxID=2991709 RepID=A0ABT3IRL8_9BACT|nr:YrhB family protein [Chitinophaga nivalis]MCW3463684.1 YrhB family protein [Chitinophaga nivalis]MCW3486626.1 YrhB family protein [Chitinophaga nivalis]
MLLERDAKKIIEAKLKLQESKEIEEIVVVDEYTIERATYFVFFYNSKKYVETGDYSWLLLGNTPFIISKITCDIYCTGTAETIEYYMDLFEKGELEIYQ